MEKKTEERIELYCQIYEKIHQRISKSNLENAREVALKIFGEVAKDLKVVQKDAENPQTMDRKEEETSYKEAERGTAQVWSEEDWANDRYGISRAVEELNRNWM